MGEDQAVIHAPLSGQDIGVDGRDQVQETGGHLDQRDGVRQVPAERAVKRRGGRPLCLGDDRCRCPAARITGRDTGFRGPPGLATVRIRHAITVERNVTLAPGTQVTVRQETAFAS